MTINTKSTQKNPRVVAIMILVDVVDKGRSLSDVFPERLSHSELLNDRALIQEFCYGVLRWYPRLEKLAQQLLRKPFKRKDADIHCLILLGLYQLLYMRVPAHAAVSETVKVTSLLGKTWARGLVNAVLRNFQRDKVPLLKQVDAIDEAATAHPLWLLNMIKSAWPQDWQAIVMANNQRAPMSLRVNEQCQLREDYLNCLQKAGITAHACAHAPQGVELEKPIDVDQLPGFPEGCVSVQDAAAQLAANLLDVQPGHTVLDACAAPGGKTGHILEIQPHLQRLVALDHDEKRLQRVHDNLARLNLQADLVIGDAISPDTWWNGNGFDRILVDAPCSASGVIRRHPDIKLLRQAGDIQKTVQVQEKILDALWPLLNTGGMLLYATCSILPCENSEQIASFIGKQHDAYEFPLDVAWGRRLEKGCQILPGDDGMDGFYYACICKQ